MTYIYIYIYLWLHRLLLQLTDDIINGSLIWVLIYISDPVSCVFASTARDHPIHLWDVTSGKVLSYYYLYVNEISGLAR